MAEKGVEEQVLAMERLHICDSCSYFYCKFNIESVFER